MRRAALTLLGLAAVLASPTPPAALHAEEKFIGCPVVSKQAVHREHGRASWYGGSRHGKKTADGQRMDRNAMTAAHRRLPLGTRVKVTNLDNGRSIELIINDRGPYVRGRVIDVSQRAAEELGFRSSGTARVRVETLPATELASAC